MGPLIQIFNIYVVLVNASYWRFTFTLGTAYHLEVYSILFMNETFLEG